MAGLLDAFDDPKNAGLLGLATGLLGASGPSRTPVSFGQALAYGLQGMQANRKAALDQQKETMQMDMLKQQIALATSKAAKDEGLQKFMLGRLGGNGSMPAQQMDASTKALAQGAEVGDIGPTVSNAARMNGIMPPSQQQPSGAFPFSLNEVAMIHALGGPNLADAFKLATDPTKMEGGSVYVDRATGARQYIPKLDNGFTLNGDGSASVVPGYIQGNAAIKGAEATATEGVKSKFALLPRDYIGQNGQPIGGSQFDYLYPSGIPSTQPQAGQSAEGPQGLDMSKLSPQVVAALQRQNPDAFQRGVSRFAQTAGQSGPQPLMSDTQIQVDRQNQVGQVTGRQQTQQKINDNWISNSYNPVIQAGRDASDMKNNVTVLRNIDLKTGNGTDTKAALASFLSGLGFAPENAKIFASNYERFQTVAMNSLISKFEAQKGTQTEGDAKRVMTTFVQTKNTPLANQFIADFAEANANMSARRSAFYQEALPLAQQEGDLARVDREWQKIQGSIFEDPVMRKWVK